MTLTVQNTYHDSPYTTKGRYIHHHTEEEGQPYSAYWNGNHERTAPTYEEAAAALFQSRGYGGYNLSYYPKEGEYGEIYDELCGDCALAMFLGDPTQDFHVESDDGDRRYSETAYCSDCNAVISPQLCPECGDEIEPYAGSRFDNIDGRSIRNRFHTAPIFHHQYGYSCHADCIAGAVTKGEATKTAKLTYRLDTQWFAGVFTADPARI